MKYFFSFFGSERFRRLFIEGSWIVLGQILSVAGSLFLVRLMTEYLTPEQYGQVALSLTIAVLINQVVIGGLIGGIGRFYSIAFERKELAAYIYSSFCLMGYATLVVGILAVLILFVLYYRGDTQWAWLVLSALVYALLDGYNSSISSIQNSARQRGIVAFHGVVNVWLKICIGYGFLTFFEVSSTVVIISYALSALFVTISQLYFLRHIVGFSKSTSVSSLDYSVEIWSFSKPLIYWGGFTWAQQVSDRWALQTFSNINEVGLYTVVFQLGYAPISLLTGMVTNFLGPVFFQRAGNGIDPDRNTNVHSIAWRITTLSLFMTFAAFIFAYVFHKSLFSLLVAKQFHSTSYLLPYAILAGGLFAAGQTLALKLLSEMKPFTMIRPKIITALIGVILNLSGAFWYGVEGVIGAQVLFSGIYFFWIAMLARQHNAIV